MRGFPEQSIAAPVGTTYEISQNAPSPRTGFVEQGSVLEAAMWEWIVAGTPQGAYAVARGDSSGLIVRLSPTYDATKHTPLTPNAAHPAAVLSTCVVRRGLHRALAVDFPPAADTEWAPALCTSLVYDLSDSAKNAQRFVLCLCSLSQRLASIKPPPASR
jgi:hypothetical protein